MTTPISSRTFGAELERLRDQLARLAASRHVARYTQTLAGKLKTLTPEARLAFNLPHLVPILEKHGIEHRDVEPAAVMEQLGDIEVLPPRTHAEGVSADYLAMILMHVYRLPWPTTLAYRFEAHITALLRGEVQVPNFWWYPLPSGLSAFVSDADVIGAGGSGGGGKSDLVLGRALAPWHKVAAIFRHHASETLALQDRLFEIVGSRDGWNGQDARLTLPGGKQITFGGIAVPGSEQREQGRAKDFLAFDEVGAGAPENGIRYLLGWVRSTDPTVSTTAMLTMNPPTSNDSLWVRDSYFAPWLAKDALVPAVSGEKRYFHVDNGTDIEVAPDEMLEVDGELVAPESREFHFFSLSNNPYLAADGTYLRRLNALHEPARSKILRGDFYAGSTEDANQVIPSAWVEAAQARWRPLPEPDYTTRPPEMDSMGVDVARSGKDQTVIARRHGAWFDRPLVYPGTETPNGPTVAGLVVAHRRNGAPIHIDVIGVGASPFDFLIHAGLHTLGVNMNAKPTRHDKSGTLEFANTRTQLWWLMRELLDPESNSGAALPPGKELLRDLTAPRFSIRGTKIYVESRDEIIKRIGHSPDIGTAYILALMDTPKRDSAADASRGSYGDYDPHAECLDRRFDPLASIIT